MSSAESVEMKKQYPEWQDRERPVVRRAGFTNPRIGLAARRRPSQPELSDARLPGRGKPRLGAIVVGCAALGMLRYPCLAQFSGGTAGTTGGAAAPPPTVPQQTQSAAPGSVVGGVQPSAGIGATAPASVQLGPVQGLGGGIRPPRMAPTAGTPLSLDNAVRIALANSLNIFTAASQEVKSQKAVDAAKTGFLPRFGLQSNYTYTGIVPTVSFGGGPSSGGRPSSGTSIALGTHNAWTASASATEPIDTSGALSATEGIASAQRDAQYWALDSARRQVILTTETAYLSVLRAQDLARVDQEQLAAAQAHVTTAQQNFAAGTVAQFDVEVVQTALANVQRQVFSDQLNLNQSIAALNNAMGVSQETVLSLSPLTLPSTAAPDFAGSLATALKNRPELRQIDANVQTARQSERLAAAAIKPNLGLQANYNYTGITSGFSTLHENWTLGVVGSWDPFDWGGTRDRVDESREDERTNEFLRAQAEQGVEYQVRQALNELNDATQRRTAAEASITQAREQLRIANVRLAGGAGTNTEVIDAQAALAQAESNAANALYDYFAAQANYQRATGTEPLAATPISQQAYRTSR
ncbi:MAG: TolC family protein [Chloroflexi bacterium]|nr:TolC family protein [Chloroflexota bacterium]